MPILPAALRPPNELLRESDFSFFGAENLARRYRRSFPKSLNAALGLLPIEHPTVGRSLNAWFASKRIHRAIVGDFDDNALLFHLRQSGAGIFPAPTVVEAQVRRTFNVRLVSHARDVRMRFLRLWWRSG